VHPCELLRTRLRHALVLPECRKERDWITPGAAGNISSAPSMNVKGEVPQLVTFYAIQVSSLLPNKSR
jgi:hypothetical protein